MLLLIWQFLDCWILMKILGHFLWTRLLDYWSEACSRLWCRLCILWVNQGSFATFVIWNSQINLMFFGESFRNFKVTISIGWFNKLASFCLFLGVNIHDWLRLVGQLLVSNRRDCLSFGSTKDRSPIWHHQMLVFCGNIMSYQYLPLRVVLEVILFRRNREGHWSHLGQILVLEIIILAISKRSWFVFTRLIARLEEPIIA